MGNTPTNAPYEDRFVERLVGWWETEGRGRVSLLFRPHPRDRAWRERFASAFETDGVHVQEASFTDFDVLATVLQHAACVVANAGTILLEAIVNDRPAVCVLYDEGAEPGESWAMKNVIGEHYSSQRPGVLRGRALRGRRHRYRARASGSRRARRRACAGHAGGGRRGRRASSRARRRGDRRVVERRLPARAE